MGVSCFAFIVKTLRILAWKNPRFVVSCGLYGWWWISHTLEIAIVALVSWISILPKRKKKAASLHTMSTLMGLLGYLLKLASLPLAWFHALVTANSQHIPVITRDKMRYTFPEHVFQCMIGTLCLSIRLWVTGWRQTLLYTKEFRDSPKESKGKVSSSVTNVGNAMLGTILRHKDLYALLSTQCVQMWRGPAHQPAQLGSPLAPEDRPLALETKEI